MAKKIAISVLALIVALLLIGCGNEPLKNVLTFGKTTLMEKIENDPFKKDDITLKSYRYTVGSGDTLDEIFGYFYTQNTVFVDWATYRQKHFDINAHLTHKGRFLQSGDKVIVYTVHRKGK